MAPHASSVIRQILLDTPWRRHAWHTHKVVGEKKHRPFAAIIQHTLLRELLSKEIKLVMRRMSVRACLVVSPFLRCTRVWMMPTGLEVKAISRCASRKQV